MSLMDLRPCQWIIAIGLLMLWGGDAQAAPQDGDERRIELAQDAVLEGRDLFRKGKYQESIIAYERAYRFFPQPEQLFVIAVAYEKLEGRCADALLGWSRFFEACSDCDRRAEGIARAKHLLRSCDDGAQILGLEFLTQNPSSLSDEFSSDTRRRRHRRPTEENIEDEADLVEADDDLVDRCRRSHKAWAVFVETCVECKTDPRGERIKDQIKTYCRGRAGVMEMMSRNTWFTMAYWAPVGFQVEVGRLRWETLQLGLGHMVFMSQDFNGFSGFHLGGLGLGLHFPINAVKGLEFGFLAWPGIGETESPDDGADLSLEFIDTFETARMTWVVPMNFYLRLSRRTHHFEVGLWIPAAWFFDGSETECTGPFECNRDDPDELGMHGGPPPIGLYFGGGI